MCVSDGLDSLRKQARGRKPKQESRAKEIRAKLAAWKQMPESSRPTLRALARDLGTSHQLLTHYLQRWEKWQSKEYRRRAKEIRARAATENRLMTPWEEQQACASDQAAFQCMMRGIVSDQLKRLERDASTDRLNTVQVKMLRLLASRGWRKAREILEKCSSAEKSKNNLPLPSSHAAKSFRSHVGMGDNSAKTLPRLRIEIIAGNHTK